MPKLKSARSVVPGIDPKVLANAKAKARKARAQFAHKPGYESLIAPADRNNGAPFGFQLREFVLQLKSARQAAGMTLAQVSAETEIAIETLSRLERGVAVNPTWQTLGRYAVAVGMNMTIKASPNHE